MPLQAQHLEQLSVAKTTWQQMCARRRELGALSLTAGLLRAAEWIEDPDETVTRMRLEQLLSAIHRFGQRRISVVANATVGPFNLHRRIGPCDAYQEPLTLTERQRYEVAAHLRELADRSKA